VRSLFIAQHPGTLAPPPAVAGAWQNALLWAISARHANTKSISKPRRIILIKSRRASHATTPGGNRPPPAFGDHLRRYYPGNPPVLEGMVFSIGFSVAPMRKQPDNLEAIRRAAAYQDCHRHLSHYLFLDGVAGEKHMARGGLHLSSSACNQLKTASKMASHRFGRCDGHHKMVDFIGPAYAITVGHLCAARVLQPCRLRASSSRAWANNRAICDSHHSDGMA
jgi:hypothetical protein